MKAVCNIVREEKKAQPEAVATRQQSDIAGLVNKAACGDFTAFGELYNIYLDRIYRFVFYQVNDRMTAEDITEEVFIKAWKAIGSCKGRERTFTSWLYRIARNHLINTLRSLNKSIPLDETSLAGFEDLAVKVKAGIEYQELLKLITLLPEKQKQVIILKFIEGLDNREIGRIMGTNEGAIRVSQMRALSTLRARLGEYEKEN